MKKYIKPSMDIVKLENVSLLAASGSGNEVNTKLNDETRGCNLNCVKACS